MRTVTEERRVRPRFELRLTLRYRLSQKGGVEDHWQTGVTRDISADGVGFKARRPLPIGSHIELRIDWPARYRSECTVDLQATGFVIRSDQNRTAVRISSHRFLVNSAEMVKTA